MGDGTKHEEIIGVKRYWKYPHRKTLEGYGATYYDLAIMELERRIVFNYTLIGDSPTCLGEEVNLENQLALLQGFGLEENDEAGRLLELPLEIISNEECYETFSHLY